MRVVEDVSRRRHGLCFVNITLLAASQTVNELMKARIAEIPCSDTRIKIGTFLSIVALPKLYTRSLSSVKRLLI